MIIYFIVFGFFRRLSSIPFQLGPGQLYGCVPRVFASQNQINFDLLNVLYCRWWEQSSRDSPSCRVSASFTNDLVLAPVIEDFIKDIDGVIAVAKDPDSWNRIKLIFALSLELNENTLARNWVHFRLLYKTCVQPSQPSLQPLASVCWLAPQCKQLEMTDQHNSKLYW